MKPLSQVRGLHNKTLVLTKLQLLFARDVPCTCMYIDHVYTCNFHHHTDLFLSNALVRTGNMVLLQIDIMAHFQTSNLLQTVFLASNEFVVLKQQRSATRNSIAQELRRYTLSAFDVVNTLLELHCYLQPSY